jgi:hypothetical protein
MGRIKLVHDDSMDYLANLPEEDRPDVVYLDPMFPEKSKMKALPKKEMFVTKYVLHLRMAIRRPLASSPSSVFFLFCFFFQTSAGPRTRRREDGQNGSQICAQ